MSRFQAYQDCFNILLYQRRQAQVLGCSYPDKIPSLANIYSIYLFVIQSFILRYFLYITWINDSLRTRLDVVLGMYFNMYGLVYILFFFYDVWRLQLLLYYMLRDILILYILSYQFMLFSGFMFKRVVICRKAIQIIIINNQFLIIITEKKNKKQSIVQQGVKMSNTSKQLHNDAQYLTLNQDINNLPQPIREIWITNKRLQKQIDILKIQIGEKDRIIRQLKIQIDSNILEDTKNRLQFLRMVDEQVIEKTKQAKQQYMQKIVVFEAEFEKRTKMVFTIERQLQIQKQNNKLLASKLKDLKQHIIVALDQKDLIIRELTKIISSQEMSVRVEQIKRQAAQKYQIKRPNSNLDDYQYRTKRNYRNPDRDKPEQPPARYRNQQQQKHESQKQKQKQRQKAQIKNIPIKQKTSKVKIKRNV